MRCSLGQVCMLVLFGVLVLVGCSTKVEVPTEFVDWTPEDAVFHLKAPKGWKSQSPNVAVFSKGSCMIDVRPNLLGSLIGDVTRSGNQSFDPDAPYREDLEKVHKVHVLLGNEPDESYSKFKETSEPVEFASEMGRGRKSEFTASVLGSGKVVGYRATLVQPDKAIVIYCHCPPKQWEKFKPVFDEVLKSIRPGGG
ncbi:MAG: hypothetical protein ABL888_10260 [Pirellulaceae bacterium]